MTAVCNIVKRLNHLVRGLCATRVAKVEDSVSFLSNLPNKVCTHSSFSRGRSYVDVILQLPLLCMP